MVRPLSAWTLTLAAALIVGAPAATPSWGAPKKAKQPASAFEADEAEKDEERPRGKRAAAPADELVETHKRRAKEFSEGKPVDKAKAKGQVDKLTGQVGDLEKKMREKGKLAAAAADEDPAPATKKGKKSPATKPVEKSERTADAK